MAIDLKSLTDKLPGVLKTVKSMVIPETPIPEDAKNDPISYLLNELTKSLKAIEVIRDSAAKEKQKLDTICNDLKTKWQEIKAASPNPANTNTAPAPLPTQAKPENVENTSGASDGEAPKS